MYAKHLAKKTDDNEWDGHSLPSFTALNSKSMSEKPTPNVTKCSFIPILPYAATKMDSIYTAMVIFKDVLKQRGETCGALWCDEGVCTALPKKSNFYD